MSKAILMSMHKHYVDLIKQGLKLKELRTWIPKEYIGPVYVVSTKSSGGSGKVEFSFWFDEYDLIVAEYEHLTAINFRYDWVFKNVDLPRDLRLSIRAIHDYGRRRALYACHIKQLEVFDKPKDMRCFSKYPLSETGNKDTHNIHILGHHVEFGEWVGYGVPVDKAPQKMQWVYFDKEII